MSGGGTGQGALYSPLPQSISDTDSSEEELINVVHQNDNRKLVVSSKESVDKRNGQKMVDYRPLSHENEHDVAINGFPTRGPASADDVPIIKPDGQLSRRLEPMSALRKIFFVMSIVLCGLTIIVFLWVLPCDWATCPSAPIISGTRAWEKVLDRLELKGGISVVPGVSGRGNNLVFLMRGDVMSSLLGQTRPSDGAETIAPNGGGVISLIGSNGQVAWWIPLLSLPHDMDCSLVDVTGDDISDCIVLGADALLATVDPVSGRLIWHVHIHGGDQKKSPRDINFPVILPDLNNDGVNELVATCSMVENSSVSEHNYIILISGKKGALLGQPLEIKHCSRISGLVLETDFTLSYTCQYSVKKDSTIVLPIQELYANITSKQLPLNITKPRNQTLRQHLVLEGFKSGDRTSTTNRYTLVGHGHRLMLENEGRCPSRCSTKIRVFDDRAGNAVVWNYTGENTYTMIPTALSFSKHSVTSGRGEAESVSGFVLKLWQWNSISTKHISEGEENDEISTKPLFRNRWKREAHPESWIENIFLDRGNDLPLNLSHRSRRSVRPALKQNPKCPTSSNISIHQLNERVVLITFNATDTHIVNTSQSDITQLCTLQESPDDHLSCQPDLRFQEQSLLVADLDQDGSQELISFLTTFVSKTQDGNSIASSTGTWQLESKVRVIRLEAELPKLYEAVAHQPRYHLESAHFI